MSELRSWVCDICAQPIPDELVRLDLGVWFMGGQIGIPHVCPSCQEKTTIADCRRRLKLDEKPAPSPPARRRRRRTAAA